MKFALSGAVFLAVCFGYAISADTDPHETKHLPRHLRKKRYAISYLVLAAICVLLGIWTEI